MRTLLLLALAACSTGGSTACEPPGTQVASPRAAGCVAVDGGRLLMVKDGAGRWSIPAGLLEAGETSASAAVRETLEEAGVVAIAGPPVCAVTANAFVAHACGVSDASGLRPDGRETTEARFLDRDALAALGPAQLRYPDQQPTWLLILEAATRAEQRALHGEPPPPPPAAP